MVGENDIGGGAQKRNAREHVIANLALSAHDHFFGVVQRRPWLAESFVGDGHFADVVKKSGASQDGELRRGTGILLAMEMVLAVTRWEWASVSPSLSSRVLPRTWKVSS